MSARQSAQDAIRVALVPRSAAPPAPRDAAAPAVDAERDFRSDAAGWPHEQPAVPWSAVDGSRAASTAQVGHLVRALERSVIPRLAQSHRALSRAAAAPAPSAVDVAAFAACLIDGSEAGITRVIDSLRLRGMSVEALYIDLFSATARHFGALWDDDLCDFATVTVGLGRLQRLLRELSPAFGAEIEHPVNGRRAMLAQPTDEQHGFGLSMVAEFFRRAGWEIHGGPGGAARDPAARVRAEWFDMVGFSIGSEGRLTWLRDTIAAVRSASRNQAIVVMVGGPLFTLHPQWVAQVGADGTALDARLAPAMAENLIVAGVARS